MQKKSDNGFGPDESTPDDSETIPLINTPEPRDVPVYNVDELIDKAGGYGRMQLLLTIFGMLSYQGLNYFGYNLAVLELMPRLLCRDSSEADFKQGGNDRDICSGSNLINRDLWKVDFDHEESIHNWMTELELFCESGFLIGLIGSTLFIGIALYGVFLKQSDRIGRRKYIIIASFVQIVISYLLYFVSNIYAIYIFLFLLGLYVSKVILMYIYIMEGIPARYKLFVGAVLISSDTFFSVVPVSLYFFLGGKHWRHIFFPVLIIPIISFILSLWIPESPRYLFAKKKYQELRVTMSTFARVNKVELRHQFIIEGEELIQLDKSNKVDSNSQRYQEYSVLVALRDKTTLINLSAVVMGFVSVSFNYYMVGFFLKYTGGNVFMNIILSTIAECVGNFGAGPIHKHTNTKISFIIGFACSGLVALPLLFSSNGILIGISVFSCKFFIEAGFMLAFNVNTEIFPPLFVPFAFSVTTFVSKAATIGAPQVAELTPRQIPIIVLIALSGVAMGSAFMLRKPSEPKTLIKPIEKQLTGTSE